MGFKNATLICLGALLFCNIHLGASLKHKCYLPTNPAVVNQNQPLVLRFGRFVYPKARNSNIIIDRERDFFNIQLECTGESHLLVDSRPLPNNLSTVSLDCDSKSESPTPRYRMLEVTPLNLGLAVIYTKPNPRRLYYANSFADVSCSSEQVTEARRKTRFLGLSCCPNRPCTACVEIGYPELAGVTTIDSIAIDVSKLKPYLATARIPPSIGDRQVGSNSWAMIKGPIFQEAVSVNIEEVYQRDYQRKALLDIFKNQSIVDTYIPETGDSYFTAGQLFTERDFFYKHQQSSAYFYENTVPVWNNVATGNWDLVGEVLRSLIANSTSIVKVYSGTYGNLRLRDEEGNLKTIFLAKGLEGEPLIPVPNFLFKYTPAKLMDGSNGLIFVTVNNPGLTEDEINEGYLTPICSPKPICQQVPQFTNLARGYTYCCSEDEFEAIAKDLELAEVTWKRAFN